MSYWEFLAYLPVIAAVAHALVTRQSMRDQRQWFEQRKATADEQHTTLLRQNTLLQSQVDSLTKKLRRANRELEQAKQLGRDGDGSLPTWANF